ncbi:MAG: radical SAM protein [Clostridia bacterium]|nr:radical SAM protein [Deltaproteobacteria bacterium]
MSEASTIDRRLAGETGTIYRAGRRSVALVYPSPYAVGMSSLGFQQIYGSLNAMHDTVAERAFLQDEDVEVGRTPLVTYESRRPVSDFPVIAFSVAYEIEMMGMFTCFQRAGVPPRARDRTERDPWIVMGGPLTFSNPVPLGPFADIIVMGEAEGLLSALMDALFSGATRKDTLLALADIPGFYIPSLHGETLPRVAAADNAMLPARSCIITPESALKNMFLVEAERGCSRGCTFCVMRRSTNGGMRVVPIDKILALIPEGARRVGLVGAAVSDHPRIVQLVTAIVDGGREIGISSLRADRLTPEFVAGLVRGGYRTLTIASDAASERMRDAMQKRIREKHLLRAAELARDSGMHQLKNYMMIGVPGETDADLDELIAFSKQQAALAGPKIKTSLGIAPFVAKRNTPLDRTPFVGVREAERRLTYLRKGLHPRVEVRPTSARWAWAEYQLSQGGHEAGEAALEAWTNGAGFSAWKQAFGKLDIDNAWQRPARPDILPMPISA